MVGMNSSFDNPTPHGGPPFQGWKNGFGFGHARGPGGYSDDPAIPAKLSMTPGGDRGFAATAFWRRRSEVGQANSFGIGDRPDYGSKQKGWSVSPDAYGDISPQLKNARRNATRAGIKLKPYYPPMEEKYRNMGTQSGPGPAKYDIRIPPGQGSWKNPVAAPSWTMQARPITDNEQIQQLRMPGPIYTTSVSAGRNSPIRHTAGKRLYDCSMHEVLKYGNDPSTIGPGPAGYRVKGKFDEYGLLTKIMNVKAPKFRPTHKKTDKSDGDALDSIVETGGLSGEEEDEYLEQTQAGSHGLTRVESSPV